MNPTQPTAAALPRPGAFHLHLATSLALLAALAFPSVASALPGPGSPRTIGPSGVYTLWGLNLGYGSEGPGGLLLGGEGSLAWLGETTWLGLYADALYNTGSQHTHLTFGPELGSGPVGVDLGLLVDVAGDEGVRLGARGRLIASVGFVALYLGASTVFDERRRPAGEVGVLLKFPIPIEGLDLFED